MPDSVYFVELVEKVVFVAITYSQILVQFMYQCLKIRMRRVRAKKRDHNNGVIRNANYRFVAIYSVTRFQTPYNMNWQTVRYVKMMIDIKISGNIPLPVRISSRHRNFGYIRTAMKQIPVNNLPKGDHELKVLPLGHFTPYDFQRPHRHTYFEFFLFEQGGGTHFIDFVEHPIRDYSVHIVFPQQIHLVKRTEKSKGSIILCSTHFMNLLGNFFYPHLLQHNYNAPCLQFDKGLFAVIMDTVVHLYEELNRKTTLSYHLSQNYTSIFLSHCIRHSAEAMEDTLQHPAYNLHDGALYRKFSELVEANFMEKQQVSYYAALLAVSPKVLNSSLARVTGKTAVQLLQDRTLMEAKRLLLNTDDSIKEICYRLNFKDSSYFTRFFCRMEGQTPSAFKSYWEEKYRS